MRRTEHSFRGVLPIVVCLSVIVKFDNEEGMPACRAMGGKINLFKISLNEANLS